MTEGNAASTHGGRAETRPLWMLAVAGYSYRNASAMGVRAAPRLGHHVSSSAAA
jgi:hypothetical protein